MSSEIFSVNGKSISIHAICTPIGQTKPYTYYGAFFTATFNFLAKRIFMLLGYYKNILCKISDDLKNFNLCSNRFFKTTPMQNKWDPKNKTFKF